jgi:hypothetical protein
MACDSPYRHARFAPNSESPQVSGWLVADCSGDELVTLGYELDLKHAGHCFPVTNKRSRFASYAMPFSTDSSSILSFEGSKPFRAASWNESAPSKEVTTTKKGFDPIGRL